MEKIPVYLSKFLSFLYSILLLIIRLFGDCVGKKDLNNPIVHPQHVAGDAAPKQEDKSKQATEAKKPSEKHASAENTSEKPNTVEITITPVDSKQTKAEDNKLQQKIAENVAQEGKIESSPPKEIESIVKDIINIPDAQKSAPKEEKTQTKQSEKELPKAQPIKPETAKDKPTVQEIPKVEPIKPETPKIEQKIDSPKKEEPKKPEVQKVEPKKEEIKKEEPKKQEILKPQKEEPKKEEIKKDEPAKQEIKKEEPKKPETPKKEEKLEIPKKEEPKKEEIKKEEPKKPIVKKEEPKKEEILKPQEKIESPKKEELPKESPKKEEIKKEEPKKQELPKPQEKVEPPKKVEPKKEEIKKEESKQPEIKKEEPKKEEPKKPESPKKEEILKEVPKKPESPKKEEIKKEEPKKPESPKKEKIKKEEPKVESPRRVEIKKEDTMKNEESTEQYNSFDFLSKKPEVSQFLTEDEDNDTVAAEVSTPEKEQEVLHIFDEKLLAKRTFAINELCSSEKQYCDYLRVLINKYKPAVQGIITEDQSRLIFQNIDSLIMLSVSFSALFEKEQAKGAQNATIGNCFTNAKHLIKMFVPYIEHYPEIDLEIKKLTNNNRKFKSTTEAVAKEVIQPINSIVIMPVQRMPKYNLLLKEVLKATPEWHQDYELLKQAMDSLKEASQAADAKTEEAKRKSDLYFLQVSIKDCPPLITPRRIIIGRYPGSTEGYEIVVMTDMAMIIKVHKKNAFRSEFITLKGQITLTEDSTVTLNNNIVSVSTNNMTPLTFNCLPENAAKIVEVIKQQISEIDAFKKRIGA